ncbi:MULTISPECIES: GrpB family protein [Psychrilyobacter]|uniref:GrpB family protein n=1 Tax=Psychrilyobacter piezotolerans TaxID=2293438 RepID=A0ABX9KJ47_9FUSO|nr:MULTISPECIES: GrpB family protein [Psychrilyobacter]MCS5421904.1 GrpB family protein [Psychrilyobacter sp. S5]NDI76942.1 GrpB family protein [Psychrilyobacter piezotolerans]RDE64565.1 GrpB family protein [Psychrilyobacter sp. S5]REI42377.1 GrpB family protein [Psychrilyobacter piezotolerans]
MSEKTAESLVPYDPQWHEKFIEEKKKILDVFSGKGVIFEHIGSTSVKEMEARPIIDIMIGLVDFEESIEITKAALKANKYDEIFNFFDLGQRGFFVKEDQTGKRIFTALVVKYNKRLWRKHLAEKRLLSASEEARKKYIEFKKKALEKSEGNWEEYYRLKEKYFSTNNNIKMED